MDRDTINTFFCLVYQNEKAEERRARMSDLRVTVAETKLPEQAGRNRIKHVDNMLRQTWNVLAKAAGGKRHLDIALVVLILLVGMLLVGCRSASHEQATMTGSYLSLIRNHALIIGRLPMGH